MLKLERPLITFDLETTGTDVEVDRIVQVAATKRFLDGTIERKNIFVNPTITIPTGATEVHGISDEMVKDAPTFKQISVNLQAWFRDCDIGGFNSDKFDIPLLSAEFNRLGVVFIDWDCNFLDTMKAYRHFYPNTLVAIYERLFGEDFDGAHDALNDVLATDRVLEKVIELNFQEGITVKELDDLLQGDRKRFDIAGKIYIDSEGVHRWSFGKYIDKPITIDMGFTQWVLSKDFPADTKSKLRVLISLNK
jgi:DNA polymerase-3 subunit epsilon